MLSIINTLPRASSLKTGHIVPGFSPGARGLTALPSVVASRPMSASRYVARTVKAGAPAPTIPRIDASATSSTKSPPPPPRRPPPTSRDPMRVPTKSAGDSNTATPPDTRARRAPYTRPTR
jgi:hypothetical protein